jgi:hypothetical protein
VLKPFVVDRLALVSVDTADDAVLYADEVALLVAAAAFCLILDSILLLSATETPGMPLLALLPLIFKDERDGVESAFEESIGLL